MQMFWIFNNVLTMNFLLQSTGAYQAASRLAIATPPPAYVLSRGIGWQVQFSYSVDHMDWSKHVSLLCSNILHVAVLLVNLRIDLVKECLQLHICEL